MAAEVAAEVKVRYRGALMDMAERRAVAGAIARNPAEASSVRLTAIMYDAKLAGELVEKAEVNDITPRETVEVIKARIDAAKLVHGRS